MLCCYSYSNPALAYTQQYNVGDTGPNGGTVTSSTLTSVVTNTEVTLNGGFEDTTTTTNWTETVVEEIATSTTTTQQTSQITATTTSNFVPTINSSDWSTEGRIKLQGGTLCRTYGTSNTTVGAGEACTGYQHSSVADNSLVTNTNNQNYFSLGGGQITSEQFEMGLDMTAAEIQAGFTLNYGVDVQSHKSNTSVGLCSATNSDCKDIFRITARLYKGAGANNNNLIGEYSNSVTLTYNGTQTHSFTQDIGTNNYSEIWGQMELWGVDAGYHTGYYGPVFSDPFMTLTYDAVTQITQTITQIILSDQTTVYNTSEETLTSVFIGDPTTDTTVPDIDFTEVESFEIVIVNEDTGGGIEMEFSVEVDETTNVATVEMETTNMDTGVVAIETIVEIDLNLDFGSMDTGPMDVNMPSVESIEADIGSQIDTAVADAIAEIEIDMPNMDMPLDDLPQVLEMPNTNMADSGPGPNVELAPEPTDSGPGPNIEIADAGPSNGPGPNRMTESTTSEPEVDAGPEPTTEISTSEGNTNEPEPTEPSTSETQDSENTETTEPSTEDVQESNQNAEQPVEESNSESEGSSNGDAESDGDSSEPEAESEASDSGESESSDSNENNESSSRGEESKGKSGNDSKGKGKENKSKKNTDSKKAKKEYVEKKVAEAKQKIVTKILAAMADTYSAINETTKIALMSSLADTKNFQAYLDKQNALPLDWYTDAQIYTEMPMLQDPAGILYDMAQDKIMNEMIMEQYK